ARKGVPAPRPPGVRHRRNYLVQRLPGRCPAPPARLAEPHPVRRAAIAAAAARGAPHSARRRYWSGPRRHRAGRYPARRHLRAARLHQLDAQPGTGLLLPAPAASVARRP
nr:hypothetical protein [Tanacetum cinerariifolium]